MLSVGEMAIIDGKLVVFGINQQRVLDLTNSGRFSIKAENITDFLFYTNSTRISVSVDGDISSESAHIALYNSDTLHEIQVIQITPNKKDGVFTNLTSAKKYYLVATGLDGCGISASD